jgi:PPM family protein phosphatase
VPESRLPAHVVRVAAAGPGGLGQDRAAVWRAGSTLIVALADGAGGMAHGARAAQAVLDRAERLTSNPVLTTDPSRFVELLTDLDRSLPHRGGQTTAIVLASDGNHLWGASVGDSGAWLIRGDAIHDLTGQQAPGRGLPDDVAVIVAR